MKKQFLTLLLLSFSLISFYSCEETKEVATILDPDGKDSVETVEINKFVLGIEAEGAQDVLLTTETLTDGEVSPIGNGFEQPAWMSFFKAGNMIIAAGYTSDNIFTGYALSDQNGELENKGQLITDQGVYATTNVDENHFIAIGAPRAGFEERTIFLIDKNDMSIAGRTKTRIDERHAEDLVAFPSGVAVRGDKLFISYFLTKSEKIGDTPKAETAKIAVYDYPSMTFVKLIVDDRTSEIGRYTTDFSLQEDENGNLYSFSTASLASGFNPAPNVPSGFLRIKKDETDFDTDYFFNFQEKSGGAKINTAVYLGNGKMLVRAVVADQQHWSAYAPNIEEGYEHLSFMIADLNTQTVVPVSNIPLTGGGEMAALVKEGKVYVNVSNSKGGSLYEIDIETATATKGASIVGHYAKGIFELSATVE
ncbi:DUF4374 domain-containing protein [Flammeovirga aprica]|uniref:DUF4374 domain-containing protein n=1 Tax=Flammeovirga aprica JL-4 TaxID=694437 RepID=A0A7X9RTU1_9BACT|nr:DUF4374 domain-containing protein [Flammeovirga aprica]NME67954.1 DUF4374 domain-containing protein [Flammeovirga aprica JL-4]